MRRCSTHLRIEVRVKRLLGNPVERALWRPGRRWENNILGQKLRRRGLDSACLEYGPVTIACNHDNEISRLV
jgi:hypothetical protein